MFIADQRRRDLLPLELLVFVVGSASLGAEIAAARLMAPYFGASTIVWANTIAVVLVALSGGYWLGGLMADRHPHKHGLCLMVLVAAGLLALVPLVSQPFLSLSVDAFDSVSVGAFAGSLFGVLALVAVPVLLLGAVSPWAIRLKMDRVERSGEVAGRLYAISTFGSLVGTFASALVLIPFAGTQRTFLVFAVALALVAVLGLGLRWTLAPLGIAALIAVPVGTVKAARDGRVIHEAETLYQYARVVQLDSGVRRLELNEGQAVHSEWRPGTVLTGNYWDGFLSLPFAAQSQPLSRIAMLGSGAGTVVRGYERYFPATRIDAVEIDGELIEIGKRFFGLRERPGVRFVTADARPFLRRATQRYDAIFIDAYRQPYIPFYLATREFFRLVRDHLTPGGIVALNVAAVPDDKRLVRAVGGTLASDLPRVLEWPALRFNTIVLGLSEPLSRPELQRRLASGPPDLASLRRLLAHDARPIEPSDRPWTDDRAPVEWLTDRMIVAYAAEGGRLEEDYLPTRPSP
jgi:spermidine synthase